MKRHSGRWAKKLSIKEMIANGTTSTGPFNDPAIDFEAYAKKNHGVSYRRAAEWVNIADRFGDRPDLIQGLCETVIRSFASSDLSISDIEQIISDIRTEKIRSDSRSVKQTISEYSKRRKLEKLQREESNTNSETIYVVEGKPFQLSTVEEINLKKSELEDLKLHSEKG